MKDEGGEKKPGVVGISHVYVGPNQRASLIESAFARFRKKGFSYNQAKALAAQAVDGFLAEQSQKAIDKAAGEPEGGNHD